MWRQHPGDSSTRLRSVQRYTTASVTRLMPNLPESERPDTPDLTRLDAKEVQFHLRQAIERAEHLIKQAEEAEKQIVALRELMARLSDKRS